MPGAPPLRYTCTHALNNTSLRWTLSQSTWNHRPRSAPRLRGDVREAGEVKRLQVAVTAPLRNGIWGSVAGVVAPAGDLGADLDGKGGHVLAVTDAPGRPSASSMPAPAQRRVI